jgi:hypothetical protein
MKKQPSLSLCIILDIIGCAAIIAPGIGEIFDVIWAPVSSVLFLILFGRKATFGAVFSFVEEVIPGVNMIPTFTIAWVVRYFANKTQKPIVLNPVQKKSSIFG